MALDEVFRISGFGFPSSLSSLYNSFKLSKGYGILENTFLVTMCCGGVALLLIAAPRAAMVSTTPVSEANQYSGMLGCVALETEKG